MKFIHDSSNEKNIPVNLYRVTDLAKSASDMAQKTYIIVFYFKEAKSRWHFPSVEKRDEVYEKILSLANSVDITNDTNIKL